MPSLAQINRQFGYYQDSLMAVFVEHLQSIVARASGRTQMKLSRLLTATDGVIDQTPANLRVLRGLGKTLLSEIEAAGYGPLVESFVDGFSGTLPFLHDTIDFLGSQTKAGLPRVQFSRADEGIMSATQLNAVGSLENAMDMAAATAVKRTLFSVGGLRFGDLVETIGNAMEVAIPQARTIADTSMNVFYRTATDLAFDQIAKDQPGEMRYRYTGPDDALTRPFCEDLLAADESYTKAEINAMNAGRSQPGPVFLCAGGWNCRHSWILDTSAMEAQLKRAA